MRRFTDQPFDLKSQWTSAAHNFIALLQKPTQLSKKESALAKHITKSIYHSGNKLAKKERRLNNMRVKRGDLPMFDRVMLHETKKTMNKWADELKRANKHIIKDNKNFRDTLVAPVNQLSNTVCKQIAIVAIGVTESQINRVLKSSFGMPYETKKAVTDILDKIQEAAYDFFYKEPIASRLSAKQFKKRCTDLVKEAEPLIKKHRTEWAKMNGFFKGLLGIIALITVFPALMIDALSRRGYKKTFFPSPMHKDFKNDVRKVFQFNEAPQPSLN